jgi:hypothetical protein
MDERNETIVYEEEKRIEKIGKSANSRIFGHSYCREQLNSNFSR